MRNKMPGGTLPLRCFETEDVEDVLVALDIGYFDDAGYYHDGLPTPSDTAVADFEDGNEPE